MRCPCSKLRSISKLSCGENLSLTRRLTSPRRWPAARLSAFERLGLTLAAERHHVDPGGAQVRRRHDLGHGEAHRAQQRGRGSGRGRAIRTALP